MAAACMLWIAASARAASVGGEDGGWWLPPNHSVHGRMIDSNFYTIFWLTVVAGVIVNAVLLYFAIAYRYSPARKKAHFTHGNIRLEMIWTAIPALIFAGIALGAKISWDNYRYAPVDPTKEVDDILIVAEQFKWNVIYPGPDRKLGDYLVFPKPTDPAFRTDNKGNVLTLEKAISRVNTAIGDNPLGQDTTGPNAAYAADDDMSKYPGRPIVMPAERQVRFHITSKDVIHDFYLPNFRVKLDAVPGMRGRVDMVAMADSVSLDDRSVDDPAIVGKLVWVSPSAVPKGMCAYDSVNNAYNLVNPKDQSVIVSSLSPLDASQIAAARSAGVKTLRVAMRPYELICEELCGLGHTTMNNVFLVITPREYDEFLDKSKQTTASAASPSLAAR